MAKNRVMQPKPSRPALTAQDIQVGKIYRGKNPKKAGFYGEVNDRTVLYVSLSRKQVQYDSAAIPDGAPFKLVSMEDFLKWASHEVF